LRNTPALIALATAASCAHYPPTAPLTAVQPAAARYAFDEPAPGDADDDLFVCLTFSGGGTRAAALAYGVLEKLRDTRIVRPRDGRAESLLDDVDCISSVSGGSFTAAYYALFGARIFQDYRRAFLERDVESELIRKALNPLNWPALLSPWYSRIDLAAELYGATIFQDRTYGDLLAGGRRRPFIILNATDLDTGDDFAFTQDQFDLIGADLRAFPVARAVAASSAFPFLLTPISLVNHPQPPGWQPPKGLALAAHDYFVNRRRFVFASHQATYLDKAATPYVHVMDGGLADNIGLRALARQLWAPEGFIARRFNLRQMSRLVLIAVNARAAGPQTLNQHESPPGLVDVAFKTATVALDNYSFDTIELVRAQRHELREAAKDVAHCKKVARDEEKDCPSFPSPEIFVIDVGLEAIPDPARKARLMSIGTNYSLSKDDVQMLIDAGHDLLDLDPDFQRLLASLAPHAPAPAPPPQADGGGR
jgi:predicted acylesterase/phospholipase RssA